jgi:hypothetical protein
MSIINYKETQIDVSKYNINNDVDANSDELPNTSPQLNKAESYYNTYDVKINNIDYINNIDNIAISGTPDSSYYLEDDDTSDISDSNDDNTDDSMDDEEDDERTIEDLERILNELDLIENIAEIQKVCILERYAVSLMFNNQNNLSCCICRNDEITIDNYSALSCGHAFCKDCMVNTDRCYLCRKKIVNL